MIQLIQLAVFFDIFEYLSQYDLWPFRLTFELVMPLIVLLSSVGF